MTLGQVQSAVGADSALVEYVQYSHYAGKGRSEERYAAVVILSEGVPLWIPLGNAGRIDELVMRYQTLVRDSSDEEL